jgi:hypothetical protein
MKCSPAIGGKSTCTYVFVFSSIQKTLPLPALVTLGYSDFTLPLAHLTAHAHITEKYKRSCEKKNRIH